MKLDRLLRPRSIAVFGGAWARNVIEQCQRSGYTGEIWPVHPKAEQICGLPCYRSVEDLPAAPDASFVGVNRHITVDVIGQLAEKGAGGAVCFASGFAEAAAEDQSGTELQTQLLSAAGEMPILGPNCYGLINYLDGALLWPDQHGGERCDSGVAIITQSSNILLNLTMQRRALPLAYALTAGNQAQQGLASMASALLDDPRVTAIGLHIEGFGDLQALQDLANKARERKIPIIALKMGRSEQARSAMVSHTNSLAGSDAGANALLHRLGIPRVHSVSSFIETLKLLHQVGPLEGNSISSMSCSGGEAGLMADTAEGMDLHYLPLDEFRSKALRDALGPLVALANPLDYHTYIWGDEDAMTATYTAMLQDGADLNMLVLDFPREDRCTVEDWAPAIRAFSAAAKVSGKAAAVVSSLPENLPEATAKNIIAQGLVPLLGIDDTLQAAETAAQCGRYLRDARSAPLLTPHTLTSDTYLVNESAAKAALAEFGLQVPASCTAESPADAAIKAGSIGYPLVLKGMGLAHKSEAGAVQLNLMSAAEVGEAAEAMAKQATGYLLEQQVPTAIAELLVGVVHDPAHGFVLTLAAGGIYTEIHRDSTSLLLPATDKQIDAALSSLRIAPLFDGFRGQAPTDRRAIVRAVQSVAAYVEANATILAEVEVNPLLCLAEGAIAVDALIKLHPGETS